MTIGEKNEIVAAVGHPRLIGENFITINIRNMTDLVDNDVSYIEYPRDPSEDGYQQGPETLANDMIKVETSWEPTAWIRTQNDGGAKAALPDDIVDDNNSLDAHVTGDDKETIVIDNTGFNQLVHFGATKIKKDSDKVRNETIDKELALGKHYEIDRDRGMISFKESAGSVDDEYSIQYTFKNTSRNIGYILEKIPKLGGPAIFLYDVDEDYTGSSTGREFNVFIDKVRHELDPNRPAEAEVTLDIRNAVSIDDFGGDDSFWIF